MNKFHTKPIVKIDLTESTIRELSETFLPTKPKRWGRMDKLSKFILLGCAKILTIAKHELKQEVGLLSATTYGSISTDIKYVNTLFSNTIEASPILFGYTLPNISLSEAAVFFNLKGSVYASIYDSNTSKEDMLKSIIKKADIWLRSQKLTNSFIVCVIDFLSQEAQEKLKINKNFDQALFTWVV